MQLGPEIKIEGKRPEWLKDDEKIGIVWHHGLRWDNLDTEVRHVYGWEHSIDAIRLPDDHPYYLATEKGFTYWLGGESAPDADEVMFRDGTTSDNTGWTWSHSEHHRDIIGYRRKTKADAVSITKITRAEAYEDGLDIPTLEKLGLLKEETLLEKFARENPFFTETEFKAVQEFIDWQENNQ